ncbi:TRAF-like superfamily protein [Striga hermonthica]|uniref:TRAF-like superfamily protein n=1 Tax=Striga hermonthica TaxID=68872 RepID=A0A9N7MSY4_STRHE|nr:TRAF-like superfamily protein [Striga hermonthica]
MAGVAPEESSVGKSSEGVSSGQQHQLRVQSGEALAEWRSLDQVESGSTSTSPPYWDTDDDDDNDGQKPSDLYGKHTWKIEKFSQLNKREHRSDAFEAGGFKWYILIYPQGCDVCNHLSLFLCVANHDKLLPGWSHFAQFTIAVVNKDPKKSKYSDTLHRFWKKEHDWGWKKFMELSKLLDGFIDSDTLIIKAQVQVIRERADRPFRCLDCQYRRELVRVYLTNVEQICRRFMEERRAKLGKLIEDKTKWSSFRAFWLGMDQSSRRRMTREKTESILKVVVKHFFVEKEVTSTLVMDSLYSGLKALEGQNKGKKSGKYLEAGELPVPIVRIEKDTFGLVDDVLLLLERAAVEPLPPKDEKGPQNRTKDGTTGEEFNKDSIERDERRLTELGRRTIEIFVLAHVFSKIEVAYQEAVALKKQEELIREEEAAWLADLEQKARRGVSDKEKKSKKKQSKQKRNNRKGKDKGRDEKTIISAVQDKVDEDSHAVMKELVAEPAIVLEKSEAVEVVSDVSDSVDCTPDILPPGSEDRDLSPVNWDTDHSEVQPPIDVSVAAQNGVERRSPSVVDDNSSTCSSDSVPSSVASVTNKGKSRYHNNQNSPSRGWSHQSKLSSGSADWINVEHNQPVPDARQSTDASQSCLPQPSVRSLPDRVANGVEQKVGKKDEESRSIQRNPSGKGPVDANPPSKSAACVTSPPRSPSKIIPLISRLDLDRKADIAKPAHISVPSSTSAENIPTSETSNLHKFTIPNPAVNTFKHQMSTRVEKLPAQEAPVSSDKPSIPPSPVMSRPLSAPVAPGPRPAVSIVSMVQTPPILARSVSAAGRLGPEPNTAYTNQSYVPQSYRNAIIGGPTYPQNASANSIVNSSNSYSQQPPSQLFLQRTEPNPVKPNLSLGLLSHSEVLPNIQSYDLYNPGRIGPHYPLRADFPAGTSGRQSHMMPDEFPHLDIINDLLDDEQSIGIVGSSNSGYQGFGSRPHYLNRHHSFPSDPGLLGEPAPSCRFDRAYRSFQDGGGLVQHGYGGSGRSYDAVRDMNTPTQVGPQPYLNGQLDGFVPGQWQMGGSPDVPPFMSARTIMESEGGSYPYHLPEYANLTVGINGYTVYRPSNGL